MERIIYTALPDGIKYAEFTKDEVKYFLINR